MRLEFFPIPFIFGLGILCVFLVILRRRKQNYSFLFFFSVFWVYLLLVVSMILFPMPILDRSGMSLWRQSASTIFSQITLIPFDYSHFSKETPSYIFIREIAANIVLTLPLGFGIRFITRFQARSVPILGLFVGFGFEFSQLIANLILGISYRDVDINDALMNALGVMIGYAFFRFFAWLTVRITGTYHLEYKGLFAYIYQIFHQVQVGQKTMPVLGHE